MSTAGQADARGTGHDEELAAVGVGAGVGHRDRTDLVATRGRQFVLEAVAGATTAGAGGVAALAHEAVDDAVEDDAVVVVVPGERHEVVDRLRCLGSIEVDDHRAHRGDHGGGVGLLGVDAHRGRFIELPLLRAQPSALGHSVAMSVLLDRSGVAPRRLRNAAAEATPMAPLSGRDHRIAGSHRLRVVFVSESRVEKAPSRVQRPDGAAAAMSAGTAARRPGAGSAVTRAPSSATPAGLSPTSLPPERACRRGRPVINQRDPLVAAQSTVTRRPNQLAPACRRRNLTPLSLRATTRGNPLPKNTMIARAMRSVGRVSAPATNAASNSITPAVQVSPSEIRAAIRIGSGRRGSSHRSVRSVPPPSQAVINAARIPRSFSPLTIGIPI